ncbi:MAG: type II toxin-antitoxin system Phd/YefM family antitoxin [Thermomicrobiales bacterium]|nr:type II toxin-antitoxin system Phd/YefM family antitoxin [Thermomicrobiales bacterium]
MTDPINEIRSGISDTKQNFSKLINEVAGRETRVVVEKNGLPVAAIISAKDYEWLKRFEANRARQLESMRRISEAAAHIPIEEIEAEAERLIAEDRAKYRTEWKIPAQTPE